MKIGSRYKTGSFLFGNEKGREIEIVNIDCLGTYIEIRLTPYSTISMSPKLFNSYLKDGNLIALDNIVNSSLKCVHNMVTYTGLFEQFNYCSKCEEKM